MAEVANGKLTPLMHQYLQIKQQYQQALVLFQVGDFYELFFQDALVASSFLGIALTKRGTLNGEPIPLCGVPVHARQHYITKLVKGGHNVVICDQLEDARPGALVARGVTQVLTPGTLVDDALLDAKTPSYLLACVPSSDRLALVCGELLSAQLFATDALAQSNIFQSECMRFLPDEIIIPDIASAHSCITFCKKEGFRVTLVPPSQASIELRQWADSRLEKYSAELLHALALFQSYIHHNQKMNIDQFDTVIQYNVQQYLMIDPSSQRNLELTKNNYEGTRAYTLVEVLDAARTPMGSRMVHKWLARPLVTVSDIIARQELVGWTVSQVVWRKTVISLLSSMGDLERIIGRIALSRASFNDYLALRKSLSLLPALSQCILHIPYEYSLAHALYRAIGDFSALHELLRAALNEDSSKDWRIAAGFDEELDRLRSLIEGGAAHLIAFERQQQQETGINTLKVRYTRLHGHYIEITHTRKEEIPSHYRLLQTLAGKSRFTTSELQKLQNDIMSAESAVAHHESMVFDKIVQTVSTYVRSLRATAQAIATLDALVGFGTIAYEYGYQRPIINEERDIIIVQGRHPVVERHINHRFIANDTWLVDEQSLWIITGPNMGGKSTFLRQVALITIMAHIGSFVPAASATIGIKDRIFTRVGASDQVAQGKSTFLVEMEETAAICNDATDKSLVILDEVGRGTSTCDGLAIAQAVAEYVHKIGARCLFATHYHEITQLATVHSGVACYYAASQKTASGIVLLYTIVHGIADGSFGLEVAKMAGLPPAVLAQAKMLIDAYGSSSTLLASQNPLSKVTDYGSKYVHLQDIVSRLAHIDYDHLTPKQAFDLLWSMRDQLKKEE